VVAAAFAAYLPGLRGPFLYDDVDSVANNPTIRGLASALHPPAGLTVSGRPLLNLSFALNYAVSGLSTWSYHALNVAVHACAALVLLGIVRRTLARTWPAPQALAAAFLSALLWAAHPLQSESVQYVVQRAESLMGLFYLLTLYGFVRSAEPGARRRTWEAVSASACLLGMTTKEVMVTAPFLTLLYDRTFVSGSFGAAFRARKAYYGFLAATWVPLAFLVAGTGGRSGSAGFGSGVPWWAYFFTQCTAIVHYLRLAAWPSPLVGDYGRILSGSPAEVGACALLLAALAAGSVALLRRRSAVGFLGVSFFVLLAPSSSVVPVSTEIMAEHRMYLPLAAVVTAACAAAVRYLGPRAIALGAAAAAACAVATAARTRVYQSSYAFWSDVAAKVPANAGAWNNLGIILAGRGDQAGAVADYRRALEAAPTYAYAHYNLGNSLMATGQPAKAEAEYRKALLYRPNDPAVHFNLGNSLSRQGRHGEAAAEYRLAVGDDPARADAWYNLADALIQGGDGRGAADAYSRAVALRPDFADARVNYGNVLAQLGRADEAVAQLREAMRLEPGAADIRNNLGGVLAQAGRLPEAKAQFEEALRLKPDYADARENLARVESLQAGKAAP
jgi:tetratricopeptide (TPR) repeat protein